ncbi:MAG: prephenate dehydrogenase [Chitinispirillales bacterium]|jgi:prephenate dehydrogenase|nr:prephenate dehydrogenase [Chitinispirillales bacterium]
MTTKTHFNPKTVTIYSVGLLGGSIGAALKKSNFSGRIVGLSSERSLKTALELNLIDEGYHYSHLSRIIPQTELLILCSPILAIVKTIEELGKMDLPSGLVITDIGSTKKIITEAAQKHLPASVHFIGGHPMAGSEKSGPGASDPYIFQNAIYVLTSVQSNGEEKITDGLGEFLNRYLGCRTVLMDPEKHDTITAAVSHFPHILASALVLNAYKQEKETPGTLSLAAGGFRDMTRIASGGYEMWHDIFATNKSAVISQIDSFLEILTGMKISLKNDSLKESFEEARRIKNSIPSSGKGFINSLSEILIMADDKPGFISSVSALLARESINIKDIEVMKVREGEGGTIRMAFESAQIANLAVSILNGSGFKARERSEQC